MLFRATRWLYSPWRTVRMAFKSWLMLRVRALDNTMASSRDRQAIMMEMYRRLDWMDCSSSAWPVSYS